MAKYYVYDGTQWVDSCSGKVNIRTVNNDFALIGSGHKTWTGTEWVTISCKSTVYIAGSNEETGPNNTVIHWYVRTKDTVLSDTVVHVFTNRSDGAPSKSFFPKILAGQSEAYISREVYPHTTGYINTLNISGSSSYVIDSSKVPYVVNIPAQGQYSTPVS